MDLDPNLFQRISRYGANLAEMPFIGIPSFFRTDLATDWARVDIGLIGVPTDAGLSHRPGARYGPQAVRTQSGLIRYRNPATKFIPYDHARIMDLGDVPIQNTLNLELLQDEIRAFYRQIVQAGIIPLSVGGDHSISYPILQELGNERPLALIHFDSHHDTAPAMKGTKFHHGAPFLNAIESGVIDPRHSIQVAIRDPYGEVAAPYAKAAGMTVIEMHEIEERGLPAVIAEIRRVVGEVPTYLSFDIDVLDPAFAPGTGTPVVGGLMPREAMKILQGLSGLTIAGADVVEVSPPYDSSDITALAAAQILFEILCLAASSVPARKTSA